MGEALQGGHHLTRPQLQDALAQGGIEASGLRLAYLMMAAELAAVVVSGVLRGKQRTYALLDERVPPTPALGPDEALAELTRRYFVSHGPATVKDFRWWSSLTLTQIRRGLAMVGDDLTSVDVDGLTYWFAPAAGPDPGPVTDRPRPAGVRRVRRRLHGGSHGGEHRRPVHRTGRHEPGDPAAGPRQPGDRLVASGGRAGEVVAEPHLAVALDGAQRDAMRASFDRLAGFAGTPVRLELDR